MKKLVKNLIIVVLGIVGIVLCGCLLSGLVNWLVASFARLVIGSSVGLIIIFALWQGEFDD